MYDFWIPMALLFLAAIVAAIAARRKRDRCLRYFTRGRVMILMQSGKWLWGRFHAYPKSMELVFDRAGADVQGIRKTSYVLYTPEVDGIVMILRIPPEVGTVEYEEWYEEIERISNPSLWRRFRRWLWNVFNTLRDAVSQAIGMIIGTMKKSTGLGQVSGADKRAGEIGNTLLGTVPNAYEPILEKYLSRQVVVEMLEGDHVLEFNGLLQEYSDTYILLRNVRHRPAVPGFTDLPDRLDIIFPRRRALVRHLACGTDQS